jgi:single-strand DNA-binding protein
MLNKVILMGRLTRDPEFRQTPSGVPMCRVSIAINRQYTNKQTNEKVDDTTYVDCVAWRYTAEFISRYFSKGRMILIEGMLRNDNYTDNNGNKVYRMNVVIDNASFCGDSPRNGQQGGYEGGYSNNGGYNNNGYNNGGYQRPQPNNGGDMPFSEMPGSFDSRQQGGQYQGGYNQPQQPSAPQPPQNNSQPAKGNLTIGNLAEFEDILSDGELPF